MENLKKNQEREIRDVYIECYTPGSVNDYVYKGQMEKVDERIFDDQNYSLFKGYFNRDVFEECVFFCVKNRIKKSAKEYTKYFIFSKSFMKNPTYVELKRNTKNGNIENYGNWGSADFYGIDDSLELDIHGDCYSFDVLTKEENVKEAEKFLAEKEAKFSSILANEKEGAKYNQFMRHYKQAIFTSNELKQ